MSTIQDTSSAEAFGMSVVTYAGCVISLVCLLLTLCAFCVFGKSLKKGVLLYVHANLAVALFLGLLVFALGVQSAVSVNWLCSLVAALLHYLFLSAFCWMLAEGIMLYLLVVRVFGSAADKWYWLLILGWGAPVIVVALSVGIAHKEYKTKAYCWIATSSGAIWAFIGPMIIIIMINATILAVTVVSVVKARRRVTTAVHNSKLKLVWKSLTSLVILMPLLGTTWILGLFALNSNTTIFAWIFNVLNSLQGFFIFLFHVLRNEEVICCIKRCMPCYKEQGQKENCRANKTSQDSSETSLGRVQ